MAGAKPGSSSAAPHRDPLVGLPDVLTLGLRPTRDLHSSPNSLSAAKRDRSAHHSPLAGLVGVTVPAQAAVAKAVVDSVADVF